MGRFVLVVGTLWACHGTALSARAQSAGFAAGAADYDVESRSWNGLSELVALPSSGGEQGADRTSPRRRLEVAQRLDLGGLTPKDSLLLVFPTAPLPRADLASFLNDGGRIAIADDFGAADSWLASFEITRDVPKAGSAGKPDGALRLRDNRNLLIATPGIAHPLTRDVPALVVNHPAVLHHASLDPVFEFGSSGGAVVLTGAVGEGRLIVLSDPSALINNMLELAGNRRFAQNLLDYLAQPEGRVFLVGPGAVITGRYRDLAASDRFAMLGAALERIAHVELPSSTLRWLSAMIAVTMLLAAISAVPRRSQYLRAMRGAQPAAAPVLAGEAGTVAHFARGDVSLLVPLLHYRKGLDHGLRERLRLDAGAPPSALVEGARRIGIPADRLVELKALLDELGSLALASDDRVPPHVGAQKFRAIVDAGERMLSALEARVARHRV